jgi:hypothetical protein
MVIQRHNQLMVYAHGDGLAARKPLVTIPLNPTAQIVMAQWAVGAHVDRWTSTIVPLLQQGILTPRDARAFGK